jgi:ATP-binding cassette subfamily B protein
MRDELGCFMNSKIATLWEWTSTQRHRYLIAAVALACATLTLYVTPIIIGGTVDVVLKGEPEAGQPLVRRVADALGGVEAVRNHLWIAAAAIACVSALAGLFQYLKSRQVALASENIARKLRERLYGHLQLVSTGFHDRSQTGDLVQRCTSDVETVRMFYASQAVEILRASVLLLTAIPIMVLLDSVMALWAIAVLPLIVMFAIFFFRRVQGSFQRFDEAEGAMTAVLQENLTGVRVVRAFARQDFEIEKFAARNRTHRDLNYRLFRVMAFYWSTSDLLCFLQMALVLGVGAYRVRSGAMSVGTLVTFMSCVGIYLWPVRQMGRILTELGKAMVSTGRIMEVLNEPEETSPAPPAGLPQPIHGRLEFDQVSFAYGEHRVLEDVSLVVEPGKTVALLGPSGAGKSTLVQLALRLIDPVQGVIRLDGIDISTLPRRDVRRAFGVVLQEPFLFSRTVRENIRLGNPAARDEQVEQAARDAQVHDSIVAFEKGYDSMVGERGVTLSGGQRQRVAIARALLRDAPILVLDDALSAVDTKTESAILDALRRRRGQATILIAHRLSTLMHADQIVVLDHGRVIQTGTHAELVHRPGLYRSLWQIQSELEDDLRAELGEAAGEQLAVSTDP